MDLRRAGAVRILRKYMLVSAGAGGLIPTPVVDVTVLAGVHVAMIKRLTEHYGLEFSERSARAIVAAIAASLVPGSFGSIIGRRLLRALPFVTPVGTQLLMAASSAAVSYLLGMLFIRHFEAEGRTLPAPRVRPMQEVA